MAIVGLQHIKTKTHSTYNSTAAVRERTVDGAGLNVRGAELVVQVDDEDLRQREVSVALEELQHEHEIQIPKKKTKRKGTEIRN